MWTTSLDVTERYVSCTHFPQFIHNIHRVGKLIRHILVDMWKTLINIYTSTFGYPHSPLDNPIFVKVIHSYPQMAIFLHTSLWNTG